MKKNPNVIIPFDPILEYRCRVKLPFACLVAILI